MRQKFLPELFGQGFQFVIIVSHYSDLIAAGIFRH